MARESPWSAPGMVAGFAQSPPNDALIDFAARLRRASARRAVDIGCGAGRNAVPLARGGWSVFGIDDSLPMLRAAADRARAEPLPGCVRLAAARMDALPVASASADLVIAHGIWNLARSSGEFRRGVGEAARIARPGAALFVFTFSRNTLPPSAEPLAGESFVFTQFSGEPQCFLSAAGLTTEMAAAGFRTGPRHPAARIEPGPRSARSWHRPRDLRGGLCASALKSARRGPVRHNAKDPYDDRHTARGCTLIAFVFMEDADA